MDSTWNWTKWRNDTCQHHHVRSDIRRLQRRIMRTSYRCNRYGESASRRLAAIFFITSLATWLTCTWRLAVQYRTAITGRLRHNYKWRHKVTLHQVEKSAAITTASSAAAPETPSRTARRVQSLNWLPAAPNLAVSWLISRRRHWILDWCGAMIANNWTSKSFAEGPIQIIKICSYCTKAPGN